MPVKHLQGPSNTSKSRAPFVGRVSDIVPVDMIRMSDDSLRPSMCRGDAGFEYSDF